MTSSSASHLQARAFRFNKTSNVKRSLGNPHPEVIVCLDHILTSSYTWKKHIITLADVCTKLSGARLFGQLWQVQVPRVQTGSSGNDHGCHGHESRSLKTRGDRSHFPIHDHRGPLVSEMNRISPQLRAKLLRDNGAAGILTPEQGLCVNTSAEDAY